MNTSVASLSLSPYQEISLREIIGIVIVLKIKAKMLIEMSC